jgi:SAM-dependent methyltransferase
MRRESFKPIPVKSPQANRLAFRLRCVIDLQLKTIVGALAPAIRRLPPGRIIDIGAGESPWRAWLPDHCVYQGLDIEESDAFGMHNTPDITRYDGRSIPFSPDSFSGALCIEVLEHAADPELLLGEIHRILKVGAPLLLSVPWSARRHHIPHDFHRFTRERLGDLLAKSGFREIAIVERGNDYCVVFNKLLVLALRNVQETTIRNAVYTLPLVVVLLPFALLMLIVAHISLLHPSLGSEDPLGYFCVALKS